LRLREIIRIMTLWDKVLLISLSGLTIFSFYLIKAFLHRGVEVAIESEGKRLGPYPLTEDRILKIRGPLGLTEIEIRDGRVRVKASPCRNKICMRQGWISHSGEALICLPNRVIVYVYGESRPSDKSEQSYDAISW